jgi:ribosomal protein S18 acetylase RimI-like enzyme
MTTLEFKDLPVSKINQIQPLWEKLNQHHMERSIPFRKHYETFTFAERIRRISKKRLRVITVNDPGSSAPVGYCIASISVENEGEIESLYLLPEYRRAGAGTQLMEQALGWFQEQGVCDISIRVAAGNEEALPFYAKFGFLTRTYNLKRKLE